MPNRGTMGDEAQGGGGGPDHSGDKRCGAEPPGPGVLQPLLRGGPEGGGNEVQQSCFRAGGFGRQRELSLPYFLFG